MKQKPKYNLILKVEDLMKIWKDDMLQTNQLATSIQRFLMLWYNYKIMQVLLKYTAMGMNLWANHTQLFSYRGKTSVYFPNLTLPAYGNNLMKQIVVLEIWG